MKHYYCFLIVFLTVAIVSCDKGRGIDGDEKELLLRIRDEIAIDLTENLLPFWKKYSVDHDDPDEGFYGAIENDGTGVSDAKKHNVLFTRYLWTYSAAGRVLGDIEALKLADRAWSYLHRFFWDELDGGVYWELNADGSASDTDKVTYGQSFAIYAFSEYYRVTQNRESLDKAINIFRLLEEHAYDKEYGGYFEAFSSDWQFVEGKGVAAGQTKSMNTHLHLLEAYTNLYRIWPDRELEESMRRLIRVFTDHIVDTSRYHQDLFFGRDWSVFGQYDSYGHDIEFTWLFYEAAEVIGDSEIISLAGEMAVKIAERQLEAGMNSDGAMIYEKEGEDLYRRNITWWVQAEAVVGFLNAFEISGERKFLYAAAGIWEYIKQHMIDYDHGGWHPDLDDDGNPVPERLKANAWTGPYHNVRMGLEVSRRLAGLKNN